MKGHVYVLNPNIQIDGHSIVKIGMTTRTVESRVKQLSTGSPVRFDIAYSIEAENARDLEKSLHRRFASHRVRAGGGTEYFRVSAQEVISAIESIATQVSKKRASEAFAAELLLFKKQIGVHKIENRIGVVSGLFSLALFVGVGYSLWAFIGGFALIVMLFGGVPFAAMVSLKLDEVLTERIIGPRYGIQLSQKIAFLRGKYPLL